MRYIKTNGKWVPESNFVYVDEVKKITYTPVFSEGVRETDVFSGNPIWDNKGKLMSLSMEFIRNTCKRSMFVMVLGGPM
jgi:hypothetical protein